MADGILAAVNENGNIDRFIDTKGGVHYIEPKRYEESVAKIDAAATKAKETVNSATEAVSECKAQTGACTQETARAKEIADTVESRITGIEGDVAALRDSVSQNDDWHIVKVGSGATMLFTSKNIALLNLEKREYVYKYNLPKDCGTPISGFCNVNQFRASNPRVSFLPNGVVQVVIPIVTPASGGTASDPYYIPFDVAVICVR